MVRSTLTAAVLCLLSAQAVSAQVMASDSVYTVETKTTDRHLVQTNRFGSNWFLGAGVGAQIYFGDHDHQMRFVDRLTPNFEVNFGKWFTPGIGIRLGANGYKIKGVAGWDNHSLKAPNVNYGNYGGFIKEPRQAYPHANVGYPLYATEMEYIHAHADVMLNLSQLICGYREDRFYSFIPYASVGYAGSLNKSSVTGRRSNELVGGGGILNRFRLSSAWDLNLDVRATYTGDHFDQEDASIDPKKNRPTTIAGVQGEGLLTATLGLSYNFPRRGWDRSTVTTIRVNENVLQGLRNRIGNLENENKELTRQLEEALNRKVTAENVAAMPLLITFTINRYTLTHKDRVNLGFLADVLKANPKMVYSITGYADRGTGRAKRNQFLAEKRAQVVYDCLVNEFGVPAAQLKRESLGGVGNMYYNDPRCSRSVLTKIAE